MPSKRTRTASRSAVAAAAKAQPARSVHWGWWGLGAVLIAAFFVYGPALNGPFIFDDYHLPFADSGAAKGSAVFWLGGVRPMLMLTYWINYLISGTQSFSYHALSVLLHAATAVLVFFTIERLLKLAGTKYDPRLLAAFGAGLFLLHPLQTESVAYIAGRSEVVAGLFYFAAWLMFLERFRDRTTFATAGAILLLTGAAVLGKESAITIPAALFVTDLYWNPASLARQLRSRAKLYVPLVAGGAIAAAMILRTLTAGTAAGFATPGVTPATYALTQCRAILTYMRLFVLPVGQNADWALPFYKSITGGFAWIFVLGIGAVIAVIVWSYRRERLLSFGLLIFLLLLLPTSSIVPIKDAIAERRVYVPIIGLILACIWAIEKLWAIEKFQPGKETLRVLIVGILAIAAAASWHRNGVWGSDIALWSSSAAENPSNARAHMGLGDAFLQHRQCVDAAREFQETERLEGVNDQVSTNLAAAYSCTHQSDLALKALHQVRNPDSNTWAQIGFNEGSAGHPIEALTALNRAITMDPRNATAWAFRGILDVATQDRPAAEADLKKALEIDPSNKSALDGMAMLQGHR